MTAGSANWSFTPEDFSAMTASLKRFLGETNSLCALLVDRSGQLVTTVGDATGIDTTAFATLTAADGAVLEGPWDVTGAVYIHTELHRVRPDARVVVHGHP